MSQDNWNIGGWFQSALDALRGQPAPEEPPYIPPEAPPPAPPPQPQGSNFFDQFQDWTTWDPGKGDWGGYHLDNGALPVVSGAGEMLNQWGKIPEAVSEAWRAPWEPKEPQGAASAADAWDTATKAPDTWMTGLPFVDIPRLALDENLRKNWWEGLGKTAKAVGESVRQAEDSPVGGVVKGLESVGGAMVAALGGAIMPLGIPAQGTEEFAGDLSWNTFGSNVPIADPFGVNRFTRQGFLDDAARAEINKIRSTLPPDQRTAVDDYLSSKAYSGYSTLLGGVKAIVNGMPAAEAKDKHQDFLNELAGQIVFDPLNLIDVPGKAVGLTKTLDEMANVKAVGFAPLAGLTDNTAKTMLAQAVRRSAAPESILDTPAWLFRHDPQALRQGVAEKASNVMDAIRVGLTDADAGLIPDRLIAFVKNDPEAFVRTGGYLSNVDDAKQLLNSEGGVYLRGMLKEIMTDDATRQLDPDVFQKILKGADTVNGAVAAIMEKTVKAMDEFMPLADPASGVGNAAWEFYKNAIGKAKNIAAHIFVSTPGVWIGNIVGNELTQVVDRVRSTAKLEGIEDALKMRGIDIKRAYGGGLGGKTLTQLETTVDSGKIKGYGDVFKSAVARKEIGEAGGKPLKESWGSWLKAQLTGSRGLEAYGEAEKAARTRAFYSAMMDWERQAAPTLVGDVAKAFRQQGVELGEAESFLRGAIHDLNPENISKRIGELRAKITKGLPIPPTVDSVTSEAAKTAVWEARKAGWDDVITAVNDAVAKHADDPAALKAELDRIRQGVIKQYNETAQRMRAAAKADEAAARATAAKAKPSKVDPKKAYKTQDGTGAVERWRAEQVSPEYVAAVEAKYGAAAASDFATQHAEMHTRAWDGFKEWADALEARHRAKYADRRIPKTEWEQIQDLKAQATRKIFARELAFLREAEEVNGGLRNVDPAKRYFENIKGFFSRDDKPISEDELAAGKAWLAQNGLLPQGYVNAVPLTHAEIATEARRVAALTDDAVRAEISAKSAKGGADISEELAKRWEDIVKSDAAPVAQAAPTGASVPFMVTRDMEQQLMDLGYSRGAVRQMTPQQATDVIASGVRPATAPTVPEMVQPAAAPVISHKDRFVTDLRQVVMALPGSPIKAEQVDAYLTLQDQLAETWAKFSGKNADEYYATLKAQLNPKGTGLARSVQLPEGVKTYSSLSPDVDNEALRSVMFHEGDTFYSTHVTSNPERVASTIRSGKPIDKGRDAGLVGDLGTSGLYFSDAPDLWMGRATDKWKFIESLTEIDKRSIGGKLKSVVDEQLGRGYISSGEHEVAIRMIKELQNGQSNFAITYLAGQPYNIASWKPEFLAEFGIEQANLPKKVSLQLRGTFADVSNYRGDLRELATQLKSMGYDGAFVRGGMAHYPQGVVWNNKAVVGFNDEVFSGKLFNDRIGTQLGQYIPESRIIGLFDGTAGKGVADFETLVHETGHDLRAMLEQLVSTPVADDASGAFARLKQDYATFTEWATDGSGVWTKSAEEKFADGFTQYLKGDFSGVPQALHGIFQQIKEWLMGIIGKVDEPKLHPEVAAAYRRYLTQYEDVGYKVARERVDKLARELQQQAAAAGDMRAANALQTSPRRGGKGEPIYMAVLNKHRAAGTPKFDAANFANRIEEATAILQDYAVSGHHKAETVSVLRDRGVADEVLASIEPQVADDMAKNALDAGKVVPAQVEQVVEVTSAATVTTPRQMPARLADEDVTRFFTFAGNKPAPRDVVYWNKGDKSLGWAPLGYEIPGYTPPKYSVVTDQRVNRDTVHYVLESDPKVVAQITSGDNLGEPWYKAVAKYLTGDENAYDDVVQMIRQQRTLSVLPTPADAAKIGKANLPQQGIAKTVKDYVLAKIQENFAHLEAGGIVEITVPGYGKITLHTPEQGARAYSTFGGKVDNAMGSLQARIQMGDKVTAFGGYGTPAKPAERAAGPFNLNPNAPSLVKEGKTAKTLYHTRPPSDDLHAIMDDLNDAIRRGDDAARLAAEERLKQFHGKAELHDALLSGKRTVADDGADALNADYYEMLGQRAARFVDTVGGDLAQFGGGIPAPKGLSLKQLDAIEKEMQSKATLLRGKAQDYGGIRRDFALLDGRRRNFDWLMSGIYPFHYWYTRSYVNWGKRMLNNPRLPLSYMKVNAALEDINKDVPPQYRRSIPLDIAGTRHYFDWQAMLNPMRSLVDDFSVPEKGKTDFGKLLQAAGSWGSAPWQFWTWGYALSQAAKGDKESLQAWFNYALPSTRVLRAGSALLREAGIGKDSLPAGGIYPEEYLFRAFGIKNQGDMWEARRIGKALADLLGENNPETGKPLTMTDITRAAYYREGAIWDMARQKAIVDQSGGTLGSFFGIRGLKLRPEDLVKQEEVSNEWYALNQKMYVDRAFTDEQWKAKTKEFFDKYPWFNVVLMAKKDDMERVSTFTMDVLNRIPPGQRTKMQEDLGIKDFVDKFWAAKDRDAFLTEQQKSAPLAYKRFIAAIESLDGNYNIPSSQTRNEWDTFNALRDQYFKLPDRDQQAAFKEANPLLAKYMPDTDTERFWRAYYALDPQGRKLLRDVPELKGINVFLDKGTRDIVNEKGIAQIASATEQFAARLMETPAYQGWLKGTQQFGGEAIYDLQDAYFAISADDKIGRAKFLQEHKELKAFWDWKDGYLKLNPILAAALANKGVTPTNVAGAVSAGVPKDSGASTAIIARQKFGDDIYDLQDAYFEIPETDKAGRRAFLAQNPKLAQYWEWRRSASASSDPRLDQAAATIKKTMGADFANYMGIPFLNGGGGGGSAGRTFINAVRQKYTPNMTESEFILAIGTRLKIAPYYSTQQQQSGGQYSRAPQSVRYLVPFSRR